MKKLKIFLKEFINKNNLTIKVSMIILFFLILLASFIYSNLDSLMEIDNSKLNNIIQKIKVDYNSNDSYPIVIFDKDGSVTYSTNNDFSLLEKYSLSDITKKDEKFYNYVDALDANTVMLVSIPKNDLIDSSGFYLIFTGVISLLLISTAFYVIISNIDKSKKEIK